MLIPALWVLARRRNSYHVILVSDFKALGVLGVITSKLLGKRCILRGSSCGEIDGSYAFIFDEKVNIAKRIIVKWYVYFRNVIIKRSDRFMSNCSQVTKELVSNRIPRSRVIELTNGVDTETFKPIHLAEKTKKRQKLGFQYPFIFIYSGRLAKGKGLAQLLRVWERIVQIKKGAHLLLVGSGQGFALGCEDDLKGFVRRRNLDSKVSFVGHVENVCDYLQISDCFVFPTEYEALSNSLLEAISCGLPCIATRVGGNVDIISHKVNGLLFESGNERQLSRWMEVILNDSHLAHRLGTNARITAIERFDINQNAKILDEIITSFSK
jgi:glycosyltransferase involved in cell wall biosynthesis